MITASNASSPKAFDMKIIQRCFLLTCIFLILTATGCRHTGRSPQSATPSDTPAVQSEEQDISARYYYLESRIHLKNNDYEKALVSLEKAMERDPESFVLLKDMVRVHLRLKNREKALELVNQFVESQPDNSQALLLYVQMNKSTLSKQKLVDILNRILAVDPQSKETYLRLGKIYMDDEDYPNALTLFKKMTEHFPDYYVSQFYLGDVYMNLDQYEPARLQFLKTIELEPDLIAPRFQLIDIYRIQNKPGKQKKIIQAYEKILEIEPTSNQALLGLGLEFYKAGNKKKADEIFFSLARQISTDSRLMMAAVDEYLSVENFDDALIIFKRMLTVEPENSTLHFLTGMAYQGKEDYKSAIFHFLKIKPSHNQYRKTSLSIAYLYKLSENSKAAIEFLKKRIKEFPRDVDMITYLSSFYENAKQYDQSIALLNQALIDSPKNTALLFRLGAVHDKAGSKPDSIAAMKRLIEIDPKDASALNFLGYTYADQGIHLDEALDLIQRAMALKPDDGYITDSLGWTYYKLKNFEKAVEYLKKAAELTAYESIIADHLGDAYMELDQYENALNAYKKALANIKEDDVELGKSLKEKIKALEKQLEK